MSTRSPGEIDTEPKPDTDEPTTEPATEDPPVSTPSPGEQPTA